MSESATPRTVSAIETAVKLGVEHVKTMRIPPAMAQECARRYLLDEARDYERAAARLVERAAETVTQREHYDGYVERDRVRIAATTWAQTQGGFFNDWDRQKFRKAVTRDDVAHWQHLYDWVTGDRAIMHEADDHVAVKFHSELSAIIRDGVDGIIESRAAELDIEWTAALLTTTVALPNGSRVLWGEATVEQHQTRLDMLSQHAATELATATRHKVAIDAIEAAPGAHCLNDIVEVAA